jgi:hypothetical protein
MYTIFAPYSPSFTLPPSPPLSYWYQPFPGRTCSALLFYNFVKEKNDIFAYLK